ncbi:MAG: phage tail tape measure protein, partial [Ruminococcus sp.]
MSKSQEIDIKIKGKIDPSLNTSVSGAEKKIKGLGKSGSTTSSEIGKVNSAIGNLDSVLVASGIAAGLTKISSAFYECVKAADKFETGIAKIETIADTTNTSIGQIEESIKSLSNRTGEDVNDLAESTYQAISASVDTANAVGFVEKANELAVGGFTDTTSAVNVLTTALNAYGLENEKVSSISDMLIQTQNKGKTTVNELASSLGNVIPVAAAYNVNMANISTSYAQLTKNGVATQNAGTYIRAMLNELAKSGSDVSDVLKNKTGKSFSELMQSGYSLGDVIGILGSEVNGNATAFSNLWSNTRAAQGALSVYNSGVDAFNETLIEMNNSAGLTSQAYQTMANTAEFSEKRMSNAFNNLKISIGQALSPTVVSAERGITEMLERLDLFVQENPQVVQGISAAVVGLGIFVGAITIAKLGMMAFNAVCMMNPYVLLAAGIIAVTAALAMLIISNNKATVSSETLTYAAEEQNKRMDELKEKHDKAVKTYGEESYEVKQLEKDMNSLSYQISNTAQTYGELLSANAELEKSYQELKDNDNLKQLNNEAESSYNLVNRLFELSEQTKLTATEQAEMSAIIEHLNELFPDLGLKIEDVGDKAGVTKDALLAMLNQDFDQKKYDEAHENWITSKEQIDENQKLLEQLKKQKNEAEKIYKDDMAVAKKVDPTQGGSPNSIDNRTKAEMAAYRKYQDYLNQEITFTVKGEEQTMSLNEALKSTKIRLKDLREKSEGYVDTMAEVKGITDKNTNSQDAWRNATTSALKDVKSQLEELAKTYDEEYKSAYTAISGTVGLFNQLSLESDKTVADMQNSLQNEYEWVNKYTENIQKAQSYGLTDGLVQSLSDGSEKSGQYINEIITQLDNMDQASANNFVKNLNSDFKKVEKSQKNFADTVAKYKTDYTNTLNDIEKEAKTTYDNLLKDMDISEE